MVARVSTWMRCWLICLCVIATAGPWSAVPEIKTLEDASRWAHYNLARLSQHLSCYDDDPEVALGTAFDRLSLSTAFSGVGGVEVSKGILGDALAQGSSGRYGRHGKNLFAIEWNEEAQHELKCFPCPPQCIFPDILDQVNKRVAAVLVKQAYRMEFEDLLRVFQDTNLLQKTMWCIVHGKRCTLERAFVHAAGTPCTDWSSQGCRSQSNGKTMLYTLAWAAQRMILQEECILHENVPEFKVEILDMLLGALYVINSVVVCASAFGSGACRERRYTWCRHK